MNKGFWGKLLLLGGTTPIIGFVIYLLQLQLNPRNIIIYFLIQFSLSLIFLSYFFVLGYSSARKFTVQNKYWAFLVPLLLLIVNHVLLRNYHTNYYISILLLGIEAPFHYVLPYLYFPFDTLFLIPYFFPTVTCFIFFMFGEHICLSNGGTNNVK